MSTPLTRWHEADVAAAGLTIDLRAGGYDLRAVNDTYGVWLLSRS